MYKKILLAFFSFLFFENSLLAASLKEIEDLYDQGEYEKVIQAYEESVSKDQVSGNLLYNLGNAYFRVGASGKSMAAFLGAKRSLPRDPDLLHNLKYVSSKIKDKLGWEEKTSSLSIVTNWLDNFTSYEFYLLGLSFLFLSLLFLFLIFFVPRLLPLKPFVNVLFGFSVCFYAFVCFAKGKDKVWGAVVQERVFVHSGPGETNSILFELHEGAPVLLQDSQKDWFKIELSDGKKGWLKGEMVLFY